MATRCTSVDQFVATFHRFCGDDQTFFVATMTSRPVGLETAFSIQLADKQPVLRGLCVVLDAWATSDNRFKRPGIRLGIKRLTADSQIVFDRLRAASRAPDALAEATPPPGPLPALPPLPRLSSGKATLPSIPRVPRVVTIPEPMPVLESKPVAAPPPPPPEPAPVINGEVTPPPIEVTRFQVALNVGTIPPPLSDVEFKPTQLMRRPRVTPGIPGGPTTDEPAADAAPAVIVDKPPPAPPRHEERTPGSSLILPANPLHDLTDESLEGFVDCTIYEDTGAAGEGDTWHDELIDLPPTVARPAASTTVPAMPFDRPPDLTVRTTGDSQSLRVAPDPRTASAFTAPVVPELEPEPEPEEQAAVSGELPEASRLSVPMPAQVGSLAIDPELASEIAAAPPRVPRPPTPLPVSPVLPPPVPPVFTPPPVFVPPPTASFDLNPSTGAFAAYPSPPPPSAMYAPYPASMPIALPTPPPSSQLPAWQRALLIGGTVAVAIVLAFVIAVRVRGPVRPAPPVTAPAAPAAIAPHHVQPRFAIDGPEAPHGPEPRGSAAVAADPVTDDDPGAPVVGSGACRFTLATTPAGSIIHFDDQPIGASPLTIDASCDRHKLDIAHARYQPTTRWLTLTPGKPLALEINLLRPIHAVTVTSDPPGADVLIDGHRAGTTPTVVQMTGFAAVHLTFTKPGFRSVTRRVYSKLAQDRVSVQLTP